VSHAQDFVWVAVGYSSPLPAPFSLLSCAFAAQPSSRTNYDFASSTLPRKQPTQPPTDSF